MLDAGLKPTKLPLANLRVTCITCIIKHKSSDFDCRVDVAARWFPAARGSPHPTVDRDRPVALR
jgi:hypothetical protein